MKILILILTILSVILTACHSSKPVEVGITSGAEFSLSTPEINTDTPEILETTEIIGVWISYIELSGILTRKTEEQFRANYAEMLDNCMTLGINTVYVHLRPFGDALYNSDYFPWSKYVTGTLGREPAFDPLAIMLEETHSRGIKFHGWLNPMRIQQERDIERVKDDYLIGQWYRDDSKRGTYIVKHGNTWYLNPAYPEVIDLISAGAREITEKYPVDGLHIDDRFYPTVETSFDSAAFGESAFSSLASFRRFNCNNMVSSMYSATKSGNPTAVFSISPRANIEENLDRFYADVITWTSNPGFTDYIIPQLYYGFNHGTNPFTKTAERWQELLTDSDIPLVFGLSVYKIGSEDVGAGDGNREWIEESEILNRQIEIARKSPNYSGVVFFSYNWLFNPDHVTQSIQEEITAFKPKITN